MGFLSKIFGSSESTQAPSKFTIYDTGPNGNSTSEIIVGRDVSLEDATKLAKIATNGVLYSVHVYKEGELTKSFVSRDVYQKVKTAMDSFG
jgi:hypothetical protein